MTVHISQTAIAAARALEDAARDGGVTVRFRRQRSYKVKEALTRLRPRIKDCARAGWDIADITEMLQENGITLARPTLYAYIREVVGPSRRLKRRLH